MGGIDFNFFTQLAYHQDSQRYHNFFDYQRIVHSADQDEISAAEIVIHGERPQTLIEDFVIIPVPGLSQGNQVLLYKNRLLFSGTHVWWNPYYQKLQCPEYQDGVLRTRQRKFFENLIEFPVEGIIPSHAHRVFKSAEEMKDLLLAALQTLSD
jgi:glyoxylase-like metal-dependent hydrolase (beta-lactamase superfamily II)